VLRGDERVAVDGIHLECQDSEKDVAVGGEHEAVILKAPA
jgi:hypothetical protein